MNGEKLTAHPLVTDEPAELEKNRLKFESSGRLPIILQEFIEYFLHLTKDIGKMSTCKPVGRLGNAKIFTDSAQKSPQTLIQSIGNNKPVHLIAMQCGIDHRHCVKDSFATMIHDMAKLQPPVTVGKRVIQLRARTEHALFSIK